MGFCWEVCANLWMGVGKGGATIALVPLTESEPRNAAPRGAAGVAGWSKDQPLHVGVMIGAGCAEARPYVWRSTARDDGYATSVGYPTRQIGGIIAPLFPGVVPAMEFGWACPIAFSRCKATDACILSRQRQRSRMPKSVCKNLAGHGPASTSSIVRPQASGCRLRQAGKRSNGLDGHKRPESSFPNHPSGAGAKQAEAPHFIEQGSTFDAKACRRAVWSANNPICGSQRLQNVIAL
jgi:hypothetical protein